MSSTIIAVLKPLYMLIMCDNTVELVWLYLQTNNVMVGLKVDPYCGTQEQYIIKVSFVFTLNDLV